MAAYPQIPASFSARRKLLKIELKQYQGRHIYCPALHCKVYINNHSITETSMHASISVTSTKLALRLPYIIQNAKIYRPNIPPKSNNSQKKKMKFIELCLLTTGVRGLGTALLTVGKKQCGAFYEYCITDFRMHRQ